MMKKCGAKLSNCGADYQIDDILHVRNNRLWIEECSALELASRFGTPVFVISEHQLRQNARNIREAFARYWGGKVQILPAFKANTSLALHRILTEEGAGCDTFGSSELNAALKAGVPPSLISVNGSAKNSRLIETAVEAGARITIDSAAELEFAMEVSARVGKRATIRLRLRPDYDDLDEPSDLIPGQSIRVAAQIYKPGISPDDAAALGALALTRPEIDLEGLMAHLGRHSASLMVWEKMAASFGGLVARLSREWNGWQPRTLDIGGGFATRRDPTSPTAEMAPPIDSVAETVVRSLLAELRASEIDVSKVVLEVEPGRSLFADTGIHLASVRHIKTQKRPVARKWVELDTTEMFLPDSFVERARFRPVFATNPTAPAIERADLVGISCGFDVLAADHQVPELAVDDIVAFLDTGAYQEGAASNFNALPRPGMVLVSGASAEWIKRPETADDVFGRDIIPRRLA